MWNENTELDIAASTAELRADNALLRGRVEDAYRMLSAAADSFAAVDPLEPARRRVLYFSSPLGSPVGSGAPFAAVMMVLSW